MGFFRNLIATEADYAARMVHSPATAVLRPNSATICHSLTFVNYYHTGRLPLHFLESTVFAWPKQTSVPNVIINPIVQHRARFAP